MGVLASVAVIVVGVVATAFVAARTRDRMLPVVVVTVPLLVAHRYLVARGVVSPEIGVVALVVHVAVTWVATAVGWIAASNRMALTAFEHPIPDDVPIPELADLRAEVRALGFEPTSDGLVWIGEWQLTWLRHPDGTVAELVCVPGLDPGFGLSSLLSDGTWVMSSPYGHGVDRTKIRVPGASFAELLEHHRAGVASRLGDRSVVVPGLETVASTALSLERAELAEVHRRLWWNCFMAWVRQLAPARYAQA